MAECVQKEEEAARRQDERAGPMHAAAQEANQTSDTYVLLTVLFASVLFVGGIGGTFDQRWLRMTLGMMALVLFVATMTALGTLRRPKGTQ